MCSFAPLPEPFPPETNFISKIFNSRILSPIYLVTRSNKPISAIPNPHNIDSNLGHSNITRAVAMPISKNINASLIMAIIFFENFFNKKIIFSLSSLFFKSVGLSGMPSFDDSSPIIINRFIAAVAKPHDMASFLGKEKNMEATAIAMKEAIRSLANTEIVLL